MDQEACFDEKLLNNLITIMGFSQQSVFLEQGSKELVIEVGNDFINQVLEQSFELARLRPDRKVTIQDIQFILEKRMKMPINTVEIENEQQQR